MAAQALLKMMPTLQAYFQKPEVALSGTEVEGGAGDEYLC